MKSKYDYPLSPRLIKELKEMYRYQSITKGNTWRDVCSIRYLKDKLKEEFNEYENTTNPNHTKEELKDLILVACMLYERLDSR